MAHIPGSYAVKIVSSDQTSGTIVELDGVAIKHVKTITFEHDAGGVATLTLKLYPSSVVIDGRIVSLSVGEAAC
jgi:hypothetical protein